MLTKQFIKCFLFAWLVIFCTFSCSFAQTITGALSGKVIDENKNPLAGVLVHIYNLTSGFDYARRTDNEGFYRIDLLLAGEYRVTAEKQGYKSAEIPRYLIEINKQKTISLPPIQLFPINFTINPSPIPIQSPILANLLQVNTLDTTLRMSTSRSFLEALPLAGIRSFDSLALLAPGVNPSPETNAISGTTIANAVAGQFSVNGQRARNNNFTVDGSDNNDQDIGMRRQGFTSTAAQSIESIQEFQISTLLSDAEAGRNSGGQINIVSKAGVNKLHAEFHDYFTDSRLNARDFFDYSGVGNPKKNPFTRNQFGSFIELPIKQNQTHFFGSFELQSIKRLEERHFAVPTELERAKAFKFANSRSILGKDILDPSFYPLPNNVGGPYGENTLTRLLSANGDGVLFNLRVDHKFSLLSKPSTFNIRYNFTNDKTNIPSIDNAINASIKALSQTQNLASALNLEISPNFSSQLRFSYGRTALSFAEVAGSPLVFQSRSRGVDRTGDGLPDGNTGPIGQLLLAPFSPLGINTDNFPQRRVNNTFQFAVTNIITYGRNTVKFGADIRRVQFNNSLDRNYRAQLAFTSGFVTNEKGNTSFGQGIDFAAIGLPTSIFQALAITPDSSLGLRFTEFNFFISNQLRLHPRVTISLGLRYELNTVPTDVNGRLEKVFKLKDSDLPTFDPKSVFSQIFLDSLNAQRSFFDGRDKIYQRDNNNFAPRVSIAWDLKGDGRSAIKAGYGVFYNPVLGTVVNQSRNGFPNFIPINFGTSILFSGIVSANPAFLRFGKNLEFPIIAPGTVNTIGLPPEQFISGIGKLFFVGGFFVGAGFGAGITLPEKNLHSAYTQEFTLSYEQALLNQYTFSATYVGTLARKLIRTRAPNGGEFTTAGVRIVPGVDPIVLRLLKRPNLNLDAVTSFESSANSSYHALQLALKRDFADKFSFHLAYTFSHTIDDVSDIFNTAGGENLAQDELSRGSGLRAEKASANFDVRHRFVASWQAKPFSALSKGFLSNIVRDINLAGILTLQTGQPFTVNSSLDVNLDGNLTDRLDNLNGLNVLDKGSKKLSLSPNISTLALLASPGNNGSIGRNTFRASGVASLDLAIYRTINIKDQAITLRLEAFNLFNRSHFGVPVRVLESPSFGSAVNTSVPGRIVQLALKYQF